MNDYIFRWTAVRHGWASFELNKPDGSAYRATVSDATDALRLPLEAVRRVMEDQTVQTFSFDIEPGEVRWVLEPEGRSMRIRVAMYPSWGSPTGEERWSASAVSVSQFAMEVVNSTVNLMRNLGADEFRNSWSAYSFPEDEVAAVLRLLGQA